MSDPKKNTRPEARLPKGMRDVESSEIRSVERMLAVIRDVYESYGFEPLDTPAFEYTDALGKFLPDQDRPNEGVFSFQDEDSQWLSLRYDLTAPLARYVAQNFDGLPKPFRRYQIGPVWRNEKPGPGRFRQFIQFDADTVGAAGAAADAELCMLAAESLERLGAPRGSFIVKVSSRKLLDGVLESIGAAPDGSAGPAGAQQRLTILRAIDKLDRLGPAGVEDLLGEGRRDESGDFTRGAGLDKAAIRQILDFVGARAGSRTATLDALGGLLERSRSGAEGLAELREMDALLDAAGFAADQVTFDPGVVRGLDYYTGPVLEAELTFTTMNGDGQAVRFGSVGGGGRYDGLVERFKGVHVPATGFSVGVSRLHEALKALGRLTTTTAAAGPVVVLVMDRQRIADSQTLTRVLRAAGLRAEMYLGSSGMKAQMKYADKRGAPCVVIQGEDERARGEVTIKDLAEGKRLSGAIADHAEWRDSRPAQFSVGTEDMVEAVRRVLARGGD